MRYSSVGRDSDSLTRPAVTNRCRSCWVEIARGVPMVSRKGHTLAELLIVVVIVGVLAAVAIPRLQFGLVDRSHAEATAWKIVTDLRRARSLAILHAATNTRGFALEVQHRGTRTTYDLVDLSSSHAVDSHTLTSDVAWDGGSQFRFNQLGALQEGSDNTLEISGGKRVFVIHIVPATGTVTCEEK